MKCMKIFVGIVTLIAVVVGVLAIVLPRDQVVQLVILREFFDASLPILAFGALIKYLCSCKKGCGCSYCNKDCTKDGSQVCVK